MKFKLKKLITTVLSFTLLLGIFTPSVSLANTSQDSYPDYSEVTEILYSVDNYIEWLIQLEEDGTDVFIQEFLSLNEDEQELFLRILQPENFIEVMNISYYEVGTQGAILIDDEKVEFSIVDTKNAIDLKETPIVIAVTQDYVPITAFNTADREFTRSYSQTLFGLSVTTFTSTFRFRINTATQNPTATISVHATHNNWNPGIIVNNLRTSREMFNGRAYGFATWRVNTTLLLGAVSHDMSLQMRRNGAANQSRLQSSGVAGHNTAWR